MSAPPPPPMPPMAAPLPPPPPPASFNGGAKPQQSGARPDNSQLLREIERGVTLKRVPEGQSSVRTQTFRIVHAQCGVGAMVLAVADGVAVASRRPFCVNSVKNIINMRALARRVIRLSAFGACKVCTTRVFVYPPGPPSDRPARWNHWCRLFNVCADREQIINIRKKKKLLPHRCVMRARGNSVIFVKKKLALHAASRMFINKPADRTHTHIRSQKTQRTRSQKKKPRPMRGCCFRICLCFFFCLPLGLCDRQ